MHTITLAGTSQQKLQIYLNDHRAGAAAGLALAQRFAASNRNTEMETVAAQLSHEIAQDAEALDQIIANLGLIQNPFKRIAALVGERLGRLKLNGQLTGYSPLSRLLEIEGLIGAVEVKRSLWTALHAVSADGRIGTVDLGVLESRAKSQRSQLEPLHDVAALAVMAGPGGHQA